MVSPAKAETPFTFQRLDHIVIRCRDTQKMLDFYVGVLGAEPEWVGRMDGALSHLRIGSSLIDLQGYEAPGGLKLHAGGKGTEAKPEIDATKGTLDHFAINVAQYDPKAVTANLTENGYAPYSQGGGATAPTATATPCTSRTPRAPSSNSSPATRVNTHTEFCRQPPALQLGRRPLLHAIDSRLINSTAWGFAPAARRTRRLQNWSRF